jgi:hypothetical protein
LSVFTFAAISSRRAGSESYVASMGTGAYF